MSFRNPLVFYLIFSLSQLIFAQTPFYYRINTADGLATNKTYSINEDLKGFYWIATDNGIYKYDGVVLKKIDESKKTGVTNINIDQKNRIWYQDFDGYIYFIENNKNNLLNQIFLKGYLEYGVTSKYIYFPEQNHISFIDIQNISNKKVIKISTKGIHKTFVYNDTFAFLKEQEIHFITPNSHSKFNLGENYKKEIKNPLITVLNQTIYIFDKHNNKSFFTFRDGKIKKNAIKLPTKFIQNLTSHDQNIWISSSSGLIRYNTSTQVIKSFFNNKNISQIFKDQENHYWITTLNEGFLFIKSFNDKIYNINSTPTLLTKFNHQIIVGTEDDQILKIGNNTNQNVYSSKSNHSFLMLKAFEENNQILATSSTFKWIENNKILETYTSVKDLVKIGTNNFAFAASKMSGVITNDPNVHKKNKETFSSHEQIFRDGLYFTYFLKEENGKSVTYNPLNNTIYYATKVGLYKVANGKVYTINEKNNKPIFLNKVFYHNNSLIGFTIDNKIVKISSTNQKSEIKLPSHISNPTIKSIKLIQNSLFVSANNAIYEYNLLKNKFSKVINLSPSFSITDIEEIDNSLYFATNEGILKIDRINSNRNYSPLLSIEQIYSNGEILDLQKFNSLRHSSNNVQIHFSIISKIPNEIYSIFYKINNQDWIEINHKSRLINLSSLAHGNYTIQLKIEGDFEQPQIEKFNFNIKKQFWQTNTFLLLSLLSVILISYYLAKLYIKKLKQNNRNELNQINLRNELNSQKLIALKSQMNPHFFYNALNTLQSYIVTNDKKMAIFYLSKFSQLTRQILSLSEKDFVNLDIELKTIETYLELEKVRFNDDFEYNIEPSSEIDLLKWKFPALLLQPIIENSLKHGLMHLKKDKKLWIKINMNQTHITISIIDNGIGRKASEIINKNRINHKPFATKATINRVNILNQSYQLDLTIEYIDLVDSENLATGTQVNIKFLKQIYESNNN